MPAVKVLVVISPAQSGFSSPGSLSRTISLPHSYSQIQQTELPRLCMYVIVESPLPSPKHYCALRSALLGFPDGSDSKESACSTGDPGLISRSRRSSGEGNGYPLQYSCLENPMDRGGMGSPPCPWAGCSPWDCKESDMTEQLTDTLTFHRHPLALEWASALSTSFR